MLPAVLMLLASSFLPADNPPYAPSTRCAPCHRAQTAGFAHVGMMRALKKGVIRYSTGLTELEFRAGDLKAALQKVAQ